MPKFNNNTAAPQGGAYFQKKEGNNMNAKLSEHLYVREFSCRCGCCLCDPTDRLLTLFEKVRAVLGVKMHITSGQRCAEHNARIGGASGSQHVKGNALDFYCTEYPPEKVVDKITAAYNLGMLPELGGIGYSKTKGFVHIDAREGSGLVRIRYR